MNTLAALAFLFRDETTKVVMRKLTSITLSTITLAPIVLVVSFVFIS